MKRQFLFAAALASALGLSGTAYAAHGAAKVDTSAPNTPVSYPESAQRNNEQGTVQMLVKVSNFGHATAIRVIKSSGYDDLDTAAASGVMRWRYIPATYGSDWAEVQVVYQEPAMVPASAASTAPPANH